MKYRICFLLTGILALITGFAQAEEAQNIPIAELGKRYQLVGKLHVPLGATVTVQGVVVWGPSKGWEAGPNLRVQRLNGRAVQEDIQICLQPYFSGWGEEPHTGSGIPLPKLEMGKTYEMEGYEAGEYVGTPAEAYKNADAAIQSCEYYFHEVLVVYKAKQINPITFEPHDFEGRWALLQGAARSVDKMAWVKGDNWAVLVTTEPWPADIEGKLIETFGIYNPKGAADAHEFSLVDGKWRLVRLEDQVGRKVELRGRARWNGWYTWRFRYRGVDLCVENMDSLPGWSDECNGRPMVIRGVLEKAMLPRLDQVNIKDDRDLKEYFIVRKAEWEPINALLNVERPFNDELPFSDLER